MRYQPVIGLEIHAELLTDSKVFCTCQNEFGGSENTRVCPRCSGLPGTLPLLNQGAVRLAAKAGFALDCTVNNYSAFDRKNYFYPDLPKAYQITQFDHPICTGGYITVTGGKDIRINHIHIEEDAGKLVHDDYEGISMADYNRCGVPLIEIVTEPDFRSIKEVQDFVEKLALRLKYAGVCDAKMEQGSMRVDVNISIMPVGSTEFGTRAELKNLNSLKAIGRAIEYEINRQAEILDNGGTVIQETRRYNDNHGDTKALRSKEDAHDYRYFPEPDLVPIVISDEWIEKIRAQQPELRTEKLERYKKEFDIPEYDAEIITESKHMADLFEATTAICNKPKKVSNWLMVETMRLMKEHSMEAEDLKFSPVNLAKLIELNDAGTVNSSVAKEVFEQIFLNDIEPDVYVEEHGLKTVNDADALRTTLEKVIADNPQAVADYRGGKEKALGALVGQTMKAMKGKANPGMVNKMLREMLG